MPEERTGTEQPDEAPPEIPWLFGCAIWVPTFAVILWVMLRLFGPRGDQGSNR